MTGFEIEVPDAWKLSRLGELVSPVKDKVDPAAVPGVPYVGLEHVEAHSMRLLGKGLASDVKSVKTPFRAGDVLYGKLRPYLNKVTQPPFDGICSTDFLVFGETEGLDRGFLAHYLNQVRVVEEANHASAGVELPRVGWGALSEFLIAYPRDKREQRAIIQRVEQVGLLRADADSHLVIARRAPARLRRAILAAGCSGRLTEDWREAHPEASAEELMNEIGASREQLVAPRAKPPALIASQDLPSIPTSWRWASVDSLALRVVDGVHKTPTYRETGIPFATVRNLTAGPELSLEGARLISEEDHAQFCMRAKPERGDLLISKDGTIGVTRAIRTDRPFSIFVSVALIKPVLKTMTDYLELALSSPSVQEQMIGVGSGLQHLVLRDLKADGIPVPPLDEQALIVQRVSALLEVASRLTGSIDRANEMVRRSQSAVLAKAFRGELSATEV